MSQTGTDRPASRPSENDQKQAVVNDKQKRLESALRANLFRRKQQARARKQPTTPNPDK